jgi:hypothetical protein
VANVVKRKRGRPPKQKADLHPNRIVFMADQVTSDWLYWRSAETGAPVAEIIRRAVAAYIATIPKA